MLWLTGHNSEPMLQPPILCPLPLPWPLVCFVLITTSWIPFADISTPLPLNPCAFPHSLSLSLSLSLPIVSFVLQTEQWNCLSEAHLSPCPRRLSGWICRDSRHTWCTGGHAHLVRKHTHTVIQCCVRTHVHKREHCANYQSGRSTCLCSIWPHLDLTQDTSLAPSQLIRLDRCVFLCVCVWAFFLSDAYFIRGCWVYEWN